MGERSDGGRLVIVCGLPGAGKTTLAREIEQTYRAVRFAPDEWMRDLGVDLFDAAFRDRLESLQWALAQRLLSLGSTVVIEWGTWAREERDRLRDGARALGAAVELRYLTEPVDVLWERIQRRDMEGQWGSRSIRRDELDEWAGIFQPPHAEELAQYDPPL